MQSGITRYPTSHRFNSTYPNNMAPPIAILGAGPAGLTLGRLLHLANIDFVIFEREESASKAFDRGGTLDLHANSGQLALKEAGLQDQFNSIARHNITNRIADSKGTIFMEPSEEGEEDKPEIDRKDLRKLILSSVPEEKVRWASKVQSVQKDSEGLVRIAIGKRLSIFCHSHPGRKCYS